MRSPWETNPVRFIDRETFKMLSNHVDPETNCTQWRRRDLADELGVDPTTVDRIINRLQAAKKVKRHPSCRRLGWNIEVIDQGS